MIFIFGSRLFGKVDEVAGLFHIATKFGHLNFVPLIPMESYIVLSKQGGQFTGVRIGLSGKSIVVAWGRAISIVSAAIGLIMGMVALGNPRGGEEATLFLGVGGFGAALAAFLWFYKGVTHASFERACALGQQIGLNDRGMAEIYRAYSQRVPANFDLREPPPPMPPMPGGPGWGQGGYGQGGGYGQPEGPQGFPLYPAFPAEPYPTVPAASAPIGVPAPAPTLATFFVTGVNRTTGETACVTVWADNADAARAIGQQRGIDVQQVENAGPR